MNAEVLEQLTNEAAREYARWARLLTPDVQTELETLILGQGDKLDSSTLEELMRGVSEPRESHELTLTNGAELTLVVDRPADQSPGLVYLAGRS